MSGAGRFRPRDHQSWSCNADLGELHRAPRRAGQIVGRRRDPAPGNREPAGSPLLAHPPPAVTITAAPAGRTEWNGPLPPVLHATAGTTAEIEDARAAVERLQLQGRPARTFTDKPSRSGSRM